MTQDELLGFIARIFTELGLRYFVTGSIASMFYGEPRFTNDIDVVVDLPVGQIPSFVERFPSEDFYLSEDAIRRAVRSHSMFNILHPAAGLKIDIMIPIESLFNRCRFERSRKVRAGADYDAILASPEDVILKKMEFFREGGSDKHLRDIAGIMKVFGEPLDMDYLDNWADQLGLETIWKTLERFGS